VSLGKADAFAPADSLSAGLGRGSYPDAECRDVVALGHPAGQPSLEDQVPFLPTEFDHLGIKLAVNLRMFFGKSSEGDDVHTMPDRQAAEDAADVDGRYLQAFADQAGDRRLSGSGKTRDGDDHKAG
jgi:hypothetical protein